jgi:hypothetical protein
MEASNADVAGHLDNALNSEAEPEVEEYYGHLQDYTRMVAGGFKNALMVEAPAGLGKSYQIEGVLQDELQDHEYEIISGHCTPLELHKTLYQNRYKTLFFDDCKGILEDADCVSTLKAATWGQGNDDTREVSWKSSSGKLGDAPKTFEFCGGIIIVANDTPDDPEFMSLKSRCLPYELDFSYDDRINIIKEIAKVPYQGLTLDERLDVAQWIERETSPAMVQNKLDLRFMIHCFDLYRFLEGDPIWKKRAMELLDPQTAQQMQIQEEREWIVDHLDEDTRTTALVPEYKEKFGKGEKTFYNRLDELKENGWTQPNK